MVSQVQPNQISPMPLPAPPPSAVCMNRGRPSRRGRAFGYNNLDGSIPASLSALTQLAVL